MKRKKQDHKKPCYICGKPTNMKDNCFKEFVCDECWPKYREHNEDDGYMTEADYQTWGRL